MTIVNDTPISPITMILQAFKSAFSRELRLYVLGPLVLNIILFGGAYIWAGQTLSTWIAGLASGAAFTGWLAWLNGPIAWLLDVLAVLAWVLLLIGMATIFSTVAAIIAAPFNGLLAEQVDQLKTGVPLPEETLGALILRTFGREWQKLRYWLLRALMLAIICLPLSFIPVINTAVTVIWGLFGAWMLAIQYIDYGADTRQVAFSEVLLVLKQRRLGVLVFGGAIMLMAMVPLLNLVVIPVGVIAGTRLWLELKPANPAGR